MNYSYTCSGDQTVLAVEAESDEEAVAKLTKLARKHVKTAHPNATPMSDAEWERDLRASWVVR